MPVRAHLRSILHEQCVQLAQASRGGQQVVAQAHQTTRGNAELQGGGAAVAGGAHVQHLSCRRTCVGGRAGVHGLDVLGWGGVRCAEWLCWGAWENVLDCAWIGCAGVGYGRVCKMVVLGCAEWICWGAWENVLDCAGGCAGVHGLDVLGCAGGCGRVRMHSTDRGCGCGSAGNCEGVIPQIALDRNEDYKDDLLMCVCVYIQCLLT